MARFSEKGRKGSTPLAGKDTLNRLEAVPSQGRRYHKIIKTPMSCNPLLVEQFTQVQPNPHDEIILDLDGNDGSLYEEPEERFGHGHYGAPACDAEYRGVNFREGP